MTHGVVLLVAMDVRHLRWNRDLFVQSLLALCEQRLCLSITCRTAGELIFFLLSQMTTACGDLEADWFGHHFLLIRACRFRSKSHMPHYMLLYERGVQRPVPGPRDTMRSLNGSVMAQSSLPLIPLLQP